MTKMKYIISERQLGLIDEHYDEIISQELSNLMPKKIKRYPHSFFMVDGDNVINLELDKNGFLWTNQKLIKKLSEKISMGLDDTKRLVKKWIIKNFK